MPTRQSGFTYLFVLLLIALIGMGLAAAGTLWSTDVKRAREAELLFIGAQYRQAIRSYYEREPQQPRFPQSVDELLEDHRGVEIARHLRRAWLDPFTGVAFELITAPDGTGFRGVASRSTAAPLKKAGFDSEIGTFADAATYAEWQFIFVPTTPPPQPTAPDETNPAEAKPANAPPQPQKP